MMGTYLLTISLGPVQSLIEAARRTRDLWCGSWLLSEAARAAALALHQKHPGCLIFPCPDDPEKELKPQDEPRDSANIANILRAQIEAAQSEQVQALCDAAKEAAKERLASLCARAKNNDKVRDLPFHQDLWDAQVDDILESFAAWTRLQSDQDYEASSKRLGGLLAARKATRNFMPAATCPDEKPMYGVPKSSLDAARESVLNIPKADRDNPKYRTAFRKLGLNGGEQLDALGLAKRLAGNAEQFTAYSRVAADTWIETLTTEQQGRIRSAYEPLVGCQIATRATGNGDTYQHLPYDAQLLFEFRLANALGKGDATEEEKEALRHLQQALKVIQAQKDRNGDPVGAPVPYAVVLKADGDRMGRLLSRARTDGHSRRISRDLHGFATGVRSIVRGHRGHAIYSGGDDVLALLPLATAVACADELRRAFAAAMAGSAEDLGLDKRAWPTLSVGLGIGHVMEPLGSLRARADRAEKAAKGNGLGDGEERDALAIALGIRSGVDYLWRGRWQDTAALDALRAFARAYGGGKLPSRVAYDLRDIDRRLRWLDERERAKTTDAETARGMRGSEVARMLDRARNEGGVTTIPPDLRQLILARAEVQSLGELANTLIIARWLSARTAADVGEPS